MKRFWIIRHGESSINAGEISRSEQEVFLTRTGKQQANWIGTHFPHHPSKIFVSEFPRTHQTAEPLAQRFQLTLNVRPDLNEFNPLGLSALAHMNGKQRADAYEHFWQTTTPQTQIGADGESFMHFYSRINHFLSNLEQIPDQSVLFGHSIWIKVLAWKLLGFPAETRAHLPLLRRFQHAFPTPNCSVFQISVDQRAEIAIKSLPELTPPSAALF
ncbi:histidine phosphatase family protein [Dichelobacter nodosus]|uniref:histidine phosphatase family protein n=1 Tax=Dichelobacter nodosus TaxID=870 RepID=UPI0013DBE011|nr:histidine phosphatase family protein [Dichelobacter nodosus]